MSFDALSWAFSCRVASSAERLVLLALANDCRRANALAFPSRERLRQVTRLDPKTIAAAVRKLELAGLLQATGDHRGRTRRIPVYRLMVSNMVSKAGGASHTENGGVKSRENGAIPMVVKPPDFRINDTEIPSGNDTKNGAQNQVVNLEPGKSQRARPDWLPGEAWSAYAKMRERIGFPLAGAATKRALHTLEQLRAGGQDPRAVLEQSTLRGWRGLFEVKKVDGRKVGDADLSRTDYGAGLPEREEAPA